MNFNIYCVLLAVALGITIPALPKASAEDAGKEDITKRAALRSRILLIPGIVGSQISGETHKGNWLCRSSDPVVLWLGRIWCLGLLRLKYNPITNWYNNLPDVDITVPGFGDTDTVECLADSYLLCLSEKLHYFKEFVDYFVAKGYQRGVDIRAAPYDWRLAADMAKRKGYFANLKNLIEEMYNGEGVTLIAHSMGGLMSLYFLNHVVDQGWKDKYIRAYVPIAVPYGGGAVPVIETLFTGKLGFIDLPSQAEEYMQKLITSFESAYWLFARPDVFGDHVVVETPSKQYTANDYHQLFTDSDYPIGWSKYKPTLEINAKLQDPKVPTYCLYGTNLPTPQKLIFDDNFSTSAYDIVNGDGDGSVNRVSLDVRTRWTDNVCTFHGAEHLEILKEEHPLKTIESIVDDRFECK